MAIDPLKEPPIRPEEALALYPRTKNGELTSLSTYYRHTTVGCRGVVLESIQWGNIRATSRAAVARFFERLTAVAQKRGQRCPHHG